MLHKAKRFKMHMQRMIKTKFTKLIKIPSLDVILLMCETWHYQYKKEKMAKKINDQKVSQFECYDKPTNQTLHKCYHRIITGSAGAQPLKISFWNLKFGTWLHRGLHPTQKSWRRSVWQELLSKYVKRNTFLWLFWLSLPFLFSITCSGQTVTLIHIVNGSNDEYPCKEVPLGD